MTVLDGPDLFHLTQERPGRPTHTLKIAVLETTPPPDEIHRWLAGHVPRMPVLRRVVETAPLQPARWIDVEPDLAAHVTETTLPPPGDEQALCAALADLCAVPLDRARPLWHVHHLTGLVGGRSALVLRLHHALADGAASVRIWEELAGDRQPEPATPSQDRLGRLRHLGAIVADAPRLARRWRAHGQRLAAARERDAVAAVDPFSGPVTPFNVRLEGTRSCAFASLPLQRVRALRTATGASINELFLALVGGALQRHLRATAGDPGASLTATVPAALPERAEPYGNSVTTLYLSLHSDKAPADRLTAIRADLTAARAALADDPRLLPDSQRRWRFYRVLVAAMHLEERRRGIPAYNAIVTSVRGPGPIELAGARVAELRSLGPLAGRLGVNLTAWSYGDELSVGVHTYREAADGLDELAPLLLDELAALEDAISARTTPDP